MSWDPKAERITAKAQAEKAKAEAQQVRTEANIAQARADAELEREDRRERRAERKESRQAAMEAVRSQGHQVVPVAAVGAPAVIAWSGQYEFGSQVMHLGLLAPLLPIALEGSVFYSAMMAHRAIDADLPAGRYRAMTWAQAGIAAGMNFWHGVTAGGHALSAATSSDMQTGAAFGMTSLLSIVLLEATVALKAGRKSGRSAAQIRAGLVRRVRYPRLSAAAAAIAAARGVEAEAAWTAAWVDRYGIGPDSTRSERKTARKILTAQRKADEAAAKAGELVIEGGAIVRAPRPAETATTVERVDERSGEAAAVSAQDAAIAAYVSGGLAECERWLADWSIAPGAVRELPSAEGERPTGERSVPAEGERSGDDVVSAQGGEPVSGERSSGGSERPVSGQDGRRRGVRRRKVSAQPGGRSERLDAVRRLLDERSDLSGADIATELSIPESTARRLRARVLRERGER